ncbi:hypothetical protein ACUL41_11535 [Virgibacillus natechei]
MSATVVEVDIPELAMATYAGYVIVMGESTSYHYGMLQANPEGFGPDDRIQLEAGALITASQYMESQKIRRTLVKVLKKIFSEVDVLVLAGPSLPFTAPPFETN